MLSLSLVDPLPQQAVSLYELRQSKINLVQSTSIQVDNMCLVIDYLKDMDERNELLTDKTQREQLYEDVVSKLKQQNYLNDSSEHKTNTNDIQVIEHNDKKYKRMKINKIINEYRRKDNFNGNIEVEIIQTINSKLEFLNHITHHIYNLREEIKFLTNKIKQKTFECTICYEVLHSDQLYIISKCGHKLCRLCFRQHIFSSIQRKKEEPKCPFPDCEEILAHYDDLQAILSSEEYQHLNYQLNMTAISKLKGIKYCLTPDCDNAIEYDTSLCTKKVKVTKFDCAKCKNCWCLNCQKYIEWRRSVKRKKYENMADKKYGAWYKSHKKTVKECPGCHAHVEKNEGCNHISCLCQTDWCWLCNKVIYGSTWNHYGYFHPQYDD